MTIQEIIQFLRDPVSYHPRPTSVQIIQTHISVVALAGTYVYKVRKPVNFGFLDYSTLERREHFSRREVELNRRLAPDLYMGVRSIVMRKNRPCFAEPGRTENAVEFAVQMRRLDELSSFSSMLQRGDATTTDIERVVDVLTPFYKRQAPLKGNPILERVREAVISNLEICERAVGEELPAIVFAGLSRFCDGFIRSRSDLFKQRAECGWIRDGHGDLRPIHIHLDAKGVTIYDCIEFNDHLRQIDVASDLAFLSMELAFAERWDLRKTLVSKMSDALVDDRLKELLAFYEPYRAAVRGKVAWLRSQEGEIGENERAAAGTEAKDYFRLALQFAMFGPSPIALCVMGRVGTGKSTLAAALCDLLGWRVHSSDIIRKQLADVPLHVRLGASERERLYSSEMSRRTYSRLIEQALDDVQRRHGVVLDATFNTAASRKQVRNALNEIGANAFFIELKASDELIRRRLAERESGKDVVSDARLEDFELLSRRYRPPDEIALDQRIRLDAATPLLHLLQTLVDHFIDRMGSNPE